MANLCISLSHTHTHTFTTQFAHRNSSRGAFADAKGRAHEGDLFRTAVGRHTAQVSARLRVGGCGMAQLRAVAGKGLQAEARRLARRRTVGVGEVCEKRRNHLSIVPVYS